MTELSYEILKISSTFQHFCYRKVSKVEFIASAKLLHWDLDESFILTNKSKHSNVLSTKKRQKLTWH